MVRHDTEAGKSNLQRSSVEFGEAVRAVASAGDDNHGTKSAGTALGVRDGFNLFIEYEDERARF